MWKSLKSFPFYQGIEIHTTTPGKSISIQNEYRITLFWFNNFAKMFINEYNDKFESSIEYRLLKLPCIIDIKMSKVINERQQKVLVQIFLSLIEMLV